VGVGFVAALDFLLAPAGPSCGLRVVYAPWRLAFLLPFGAPRLDFLVLLFAFGMGRPFAGRPSL
jgi:hypothetical protein